MSLTPKEAAELVGMSKQGIIRAIHKGQLSATRNEHGHFEIEPVELFRVYPPATTADNPTHSEEAAHLPDNDNRIEMLERMIRDKDETISDLRQRLDAEADERRKLTLILTDRNAETPRAAWWQRLWRRG